MKIGIVGCGGRMGSMLVHATLEHPDAEFSGGTEPHGSPMVGKMVAGQVISDDPGALFDASDAIIDFTAPAATVAHAGLALETGTALIIGTTGLSPDQQASIEAAASRAVLVQAANFSIGVNLLIGLTRQVSALLADNYDIEIVEMHHHHKVDAPSGTALALGRAAADGRKVDLEAVADKVRDGHTGARRQGDIGFATLRGGDVVGDHTVMFAGDGERVELTHKASSRMIFANGAVASAIWAKDKAPGLYSMADVLGLSAGGR